MALMEAIADAWVRGETRAALDRFTEDARYVEPPDAQRYAGRDELFAFFGGDDPPAMTMTWHHLVFDPEQQLGAGEYTFTGTRTYHGIALVRLEGDRIADWREYQYRSELPWETFSAGNRF